LYFHRIFKSKEYLAGRLAVFHSDFIIPAAKQEVVSNMDLMNNILFPWKELDGRISVPISTVGPVISAGIV
jgi:hypothetical protein